MKIVNIADEKRAILENYLLSPQGVNCRQVFGMCRPVMEQLKGEVPSPGSWLDTLHKCCLSLYFPDNFPGEGARGLKPCFDFYFDVLGELIKREKRELPFDPCRDFAYLTEEELKKSGIREEYLRFKESYAGIHLYEFMRIAREITPFDTLGHIAGVHHVAMSVARQLEKRDIPVDLALLSAAAILHDVGKFGCRPGEARRVPYLHYYYTRQFANRFRLEGIGHIAANHSTWDLELENLSVENLLLIYADFRVKSVRENHKEKVCFWSLDDAYEVILGKLDNVDETKRRRYGKVFSKLKDFENYLKSLGVSVGLNGEPALDVEDREPGLLEMPQLAEAFKFRAIASNITIMHRIQRRPEFMNLLDEAKNEKNWRNVRIYLNILDEYSTYMSAKQKEAVIRFLYEMQMHRDGDIRRHGARLIGRLIVSVEERYQKELPEDVSLPKPALSSLDVWADALQRMLIPDHKITQQHKRWIGFSMKSVFTTILEQVSIPAGAEYLEILMAYYRSPPDSGLLAFILMDCAAVIPFGLCKDARREILLNFTRNAMERGDPEIFTAALQFLAHWMEEGWIPDEKELSWLEPAMALKKDTPACCRYLMEKIGAYSKKGGREGEFFRLDPASISEILMENQRIEVPWIFKQVNLEILDKACQGGKAEAWFQLGVHFANMLQTSDRIVIKYLAGDNLLRLLPRLANTEKYELAIELLRGLEIGEYSTSKYIPAYLGKMFFHLEEYSQYKLLERFRWMVDSTNFSVAIVTLDTIGVIAGHSGEGREGQPGFEGNSVSEEIRIKLEGMLLRGVSHYAQEVRLEALWVIGHSIFGNPRLPLGRKAEYFLSMGRKLKTMMGKEKNNLCRYNYGAVLNHIYRFLSDYSLGFGCLPEEKEKKMAFFPGTFDPFSLGHKGMVEELRRHGFRVFLALDEFSWSKRVQPYKIRQQIVKMSIADLNDVYLLPENLVVNIANPDDLRKLRAFFGNKEVWLVVGRDVVENASAYKKSPEEGSVHSFPHIVFHRGGQDKSQICVQRIKGEALSLTLPKKYEAVSSSRIREYVDLNRDISNLVDTNVQNYIEEYGLYRREPVFKLTMASRAINRIYQERIPGDMVRELAAGLFKEDWNHGRGEFALRLEGEQLVGIRDEKQYGQMVGAVLFHPVSFCGLYQECGDEKLTGWLRKHISGRIAWITGIYERCEGRSRGYAQLALTEMLAVCLEQEYTYAICLQPGSSRELLLRQGFVPVPAKRDCFLVDLRNPLLLFCDAKMCLKEPFRSHEALAARMEEKRKLLQGALASLYPGNLVLCLESEVVNHRVLKMIARENPAASRMPAFGQAGENMCVPFGKILRGMLAANCVTKALDTEKIYEPDLSGFTIREYPNFADLHTQVKILRSFKRPVILVDDLYHEGYRMEGIEPILEKEEVEIKKIIVGAMSGNGRDIAYRKKKPVEGAYFIPNIKAWVTESGFYPFIGGESVRKEEGEGTGAALLPSVNDILPYQIPHFLRDVRLGDFYRFSELCLSNARAILEGVEQIYQEMSGRRLTVRRLGEVMAEPRYPDIRQVEISGRTAAECLGDEQQRLKRFECLCGMDRV